MKKRRKMNFKRTVALAAAFAMISAGCSELNLSNSRLSVSAAVLCF